MIYFYLKMKIYNIAYMKQMIIVIYVNQNINFQMECVFQKIVKMKIVKIV